MKKRKIKLGRTMLILLPFVVVALFCGFRDVSANDEKIFEYEYHFKNKYSAEYLSIIRNKNNVFPFEDINEAILSLNEIINSYGDEEETTFVDFSDIKIQKNKLKITDKEIYNLLEKKVSEGDSYMRIYNKIVVNASAECSNIADVKEYLSEYTIGSGKIQSLITERKAEERILIYFINDCCKQIKLEAEVLNDYSIKINGNIYPIDYFFN